MNTENQNGYMLLFRGNDWLKKLSPEEKQKVTDQWMAWFRRLTEEGKQPTAQALKELTLMIVDSNDPMGEKYYQLGGSDASVQRLIRVCGLSRVGIKSAEWSFTTLTADDMREFAQSRLAGYKRPRDYEFRSELPRTDSGKLLKRVLRDEYWQDRERAV